MPVHGPPQPPDPTPPTTSAEQSSRLSGSHPSATAAASRGVSVPRSKRRMVASSSSSSSSSAAAAGYALAATAMALSGTLVLFSLCRAKPNPGCPAEAADAAPSPRLRPCLSSSEKRKREKARRGSMKRVRFADDVVDNGIATARAAPAPAQLRTAAMPANREALYRGMLRGRSMLRVACSY